MGIVKSYEAYYKKAANPLPLKIIGIADCEAYDILPAAKAQIACFKYTKIPCSTIPSHNFAHILPPKIPSSE